MWPVTEMRNNSWLAAGAAKLVWVCVQGKNNPTDTEWIQQPLKDAEGYEKHNRS
jgi:hypothetical protein